MKKNLIIFLNGPDEPEAALILLSIQATALKTYTL
jgi:hypothetical protein